MNRTMNTGSTGTAVVWEGTIKVDPNQLREMSPTIEGWDHTINYETGEIHFQPLKNLVVDSGIQRSLDKLVGRNGPPGNVITMGVDDGVSNPVAGTTSSTAGSTNRRLVNFDATPGRTANVLTMDGTFTQASVSFIMKRLFLSAAAAGTSDSAGDLYSMTNVFTIDFTSFSVWSLTFTATVTGIGA